MPLPPCVNECADADGNEEQPSAPTYYRRPEDLERLRRCGTCHANRRARLGDGPRCEVADCGYPPRLLRPRLGYHRALTPR